MRQQIINRPTDFSPFLGIATGKRKKAKAEAAAKIEEEKRKTLSLQIEAAKAGYVAPEVKVEQTKAEVEKAKTDAELTTAQTAAQSSNTLYYVIGGVLVAVIVALILIKRK
jgi:hypothetical protein